MSSSALLADTVMQPLSAEPVGGSSLVNCRMLRLDLLNPPASGNKYFKLQHFLMALQPGQKLVSFGGAWSNHIHALAALGRERGVATVGIIRGERPSRLSAMLADAERWGMQLEFVSRSDYRRRGDPAWLAEWELKIGPCLMVPEGGASDLGVSGCRDIADLVTEHASDATLVALACGTGCTLAGLAAALPAAMGVLGVVVLKGVAVQMSTDINRWIQHQGGNSCHWQLSADYHGGGYARCSDELTAFISEFERVQGVPLEPVYTGKMMQALYHMAATGLLDPATPLVAVHTGGLQGRRGFPALAALATGLLSRP